MAEIICRFGDPSKPGLSYEIVGSLKPIDGLFTIDQSGPCGGCLAREGKVKISGGVELKYSQDYEKIDLGLIAVEAVEKINIVVSCEQV